MPRVVFAPEDTVSLKREDSPIPFGNESTGDEIV